MTSRMSYERVRIRDRVRDRPSPSPYTNLDVEDVVREGWAYMWVSLP